MNFLDFLRTQLEHSPAMQTETQGRTYSPLGTSSPATDTPLASTSRSSPDPPFPIPARAVMLLVRPRQPQSPLTTSQAGHSKRTSGVTWSGTDSLNVDNIRRSHSISSSSSPKAPESFSRVASDRDSAPKRRQPSSLLGKDRSFTLSEDSDSQKIMNNMLATHNLELVTSRASLSPSAASPRSSLQLYVKRTPSLIQVPNEGEIDLPVRIQPISEIEDESSNAASSSHRPTSLSSISLGFPLTTPNTPQDTNEVQAYTILGTLDPGTCESKDVTVTSPDAVSDPSLRVMKITSKRWSRALTVEGEQSVLQWLSEIAADEQQRAKNQISGLNFLQRMTTSFENKELTFMVLVSARIFTKRNDVVLRWRITY